MGVTIPILIKITHSSKKIFSKAKNGNALTQNLNVTADAGASPMIATGGENASISQEMHIHQRTDTSGERRNTLRALKKANDGIIWAIDQSKNPRIKNTPDSYVEKLEGVFESNFAKFKKSDLDVLEPLIDEIVAHRKKFPELEAPCTALNEAIDALKSDCSTR